ncbi:hypothetical protein BDV11DRAFT_176346 [Aspergillus similis]
MRRTREAAHQTLEFRFEIDAELKKDEERRQRAMVPAAGGCGAGALEETNQFWRQVFSAATAATPHKGAATYLLGQGLGSI